jgi:hypothetical protein
MTIATANSLCWTQPPSKLRLSVVFDEVYPLEPTELDVHRDVGRVAIYPPFDIGVSCAVNLLVLAYPSPQKHHIIFGDPSDCMNRHIPCLIARIELSALFCQGL